MSSLAAAATLTGWKLMTKGCVCLPLVVAHQSGNNGTNQCWPGPLYCQNRRNNTTAGHAETICYSSTIVRSLHHHHDRRHTLQLVATSVVCCELSASVFKTRWWTDKMRQFDSDTTYYVHFASLSIAPEKKCTRCLSMFCTSYLVQCRRCTKYAMSYSSYYALCSIIYAIALWNSYVLQHLLDIMFQFCSSYRSSVEILQQLLGTVFQFCSIHYT